MSQDPAASAAAEAVVPLAAESAAPAGRDAGDEDAVALRDRCDRVAFGDDGADCLVPEDPPGPTVGTSPLRMCRSVPQMVEEPISTTTSEGSRTIGSGTGSQVRTPGPPYVSAFMWHPLSLLWEYPYDVAPAGIGGRHDRT